MTPSKSTARCGMRISAFQVSLTSTEISDAGREADAPRLPERTSFNIAPLWHGRSVNVSQNSVHQNGGR